MGFFFFPHQREIAPKRARHLQKKHWADGWDEGQAGFGSFSFSTCRCHLQDVTRLLGTVLG